MNILMKTTLLFILAISSQMVFAHDTTVKYSHGTDTDRVDNNKITAEHLTINKMLSDSFGIEYRHGMYSGANSDFTSNALLISSRYRRTSFSVSGSLGAAVMDHQSSEVYLVGDLYIDYTANEWLDLSAGVYGDAVESIIGLQEVYNYTGYNVGMDLHEDGVGLAVSAHKQHYSDNNIRNLVNAKLYYGFSDGWSFYTSHKRYSNSEGFNGVYFNPEEYSRHNVGFSFRKMACKTIRVVGYAHTGISIINEEKGKPAHGFKVKLEYLPKRVFVSILSDYSDNTNYRYTLGEIGITF